MFEKRSLQVKMVKDEKNTENASQALEPSFQQKVVIIGTQVGTVVEQAGKALLMYVLVDTLRQVAIERAKK